MKKVTAFVITVLLVSATNAKASDSSSEERSSFGFNRQYPSPVNFNEIFTNSLSMLNDDTGVTTKDDDFHLNSLQTQFAEFRSQSIVTTTTSPTTTPKPRFLTAAYLKKETTTEPGSGSTTTAPDPKHTSVPSLITTQKPEENSERVLPLKNYQRGVLDLIFPASRVKHFKNVFDTVRRMLSYTFRK